MAGDRASDCRLGLLAFGDSITNGGGELQWGVALQSWALWTARGLGLPYTGFAQDGARAADVATGQLAAFAERTPADARFDVGALYVGVNDVRALDWDAGAFSRDHRVTLDFLHARCDRVLAATMPRDLGRPLAAHVEEGNAIVTAAARETGALLLDLRDFGARNLVMADHVHPTAFGQIAIAERALDVLAADGMTVRVRPSSLVEWETTRAGCLRGDLTYAYRHAKVSARAAWIRAAVSARAAAARRAGAAVAGESGRR